MGRVNQKSFKPMMWGIIIVLIAVVFIPACTKQKINEGVAYYTCGMHPSVNIKPAEYAKGQTQCPICNMDLVPVKKASESTNMVALDGTTMTHETTKPRLEVPQEQLKRAGVLTERLKRRLLCNARYCFEF